MKEIKLWFYHYQPNQTRGKFTLEDMETHIKRRYLKFDVQKLKYVDKQENERSFVKQFKSMFKNASKGGVTFAFDEKGNCGFCFCSPKDQFSKAIGRARSSGHLITQLYPNSRTGLKYTLVGNVMYIQERVYNEYTKIWAWEKIS